MMNVGPTFFSSPSGDHPAGDGLTRLQCLFAGGSTADVSGYGEGVDIVDLAPYQILGDGYAKILLGAGPNYISWTGNDLGRNPNTGHTIECFVKFEENAANPSSLLEGVVIDMLNMAGSSLNITGFSGGINAANLASIAYYTWTDTVDAFSNRFANYTHVAWVCDSSSNGDLRVYINGDLKVTYNTGPLTKTVPYSGGITIGTDNIPIVSTSWIYCSGVRIRRAEMYTGASFTPPTSPAAWGSP